MVALLDGRVVQLKWNANRVRTIRTCRSFVVSNDTAAGPLQHDRNLAQGLVNMCKMRAALASLPRLGDEHKGGLKNNKKNPEFLCVAVAGSKQIFVRVRVCVCVCVCVRLQSNHLTVNITGPSYVMVTPATVRIFEAFVA